MKPNADTPISPFRRVLLSVIQAVIRPDEIRLVVARSCPGHTLVPNEVLHNLTKWTAAQKAVFDTQLEAIHGLEAVTGRHWYGRERT